MAFSGRDYIMNYYESLELAQSIRDWWMKNFDKEVNVWLEHEVREGNRKFYYVRSDITQRVPPSLRRKKKRVS